MPHLRRLGDPPGGWAAAALEAEGVTVARGVFGARMDVELVNAGPVTIVLDVESPPQQ